MPPPSGHCYYQMVVTPVIEQILPESPGSRIPHTVTLVSIPACTDGKRGFSVSIDQHCNSQGCGTEHSHTVRVREYVPVVGVAGGGQSPGAAGTDLPWLQWEARSQKFLPSVLGDPANLSTALQHWRRGTLASVQSLVSYEQQ